ncbi:MAG: UDP-N-acetylmuramoyl-L-alanine--D-glutamate ligase [Gemmatimonadaceae bacterium]|nr:UDP-N-acetylmuramoyl-L-alanine--D-glutamate ligase [Gemmatimonadaceae bacterium]
MTADAHSSHSYSPAETAALVARHLAERTGEFAVIGLARSGEAAARLLCRAGVRVYVSDRSDNDAVQQSAARLRGEGAQVDVGTHDLARIARAVCVVASPGVPPNAPPMAAARAAGVPIVSEVEVALRLTPALRYIAVTGTNGKTTTTAMIGVLLRALGHVAVDVGNIGTPVSEIPLLDPAPSWAALELSSFQLHDTPGLLPDVGVLTTLSPDHLDRYQGVDDYYADKRLLFANATAQSRWVVTSDNADAARLVEGIPGQWHRFSTERRDVDAYFDRVSGMLHVLGVPVMHRDALALAGDHNVANALAALLAVMVADASHRTPTALQALAKALTGFHALAHRLEPVGDAHGITWLNDSKATNVASTQVALAGMTRPTVLLLGGRHKGEPYTALLPEIRRTVKAVIAYGEAATTIAQDLSELPGHGVTLESMADADFPTVVARARALAASGDVILLSPACSSYDMFNNYEERGRAFARLAKELA